MRVSSCLRNVQNNGLPGRPVGAIFHLSSPFLQQISTSTAPPTPTLRFPTALHPSHITCRIPASFSLDGTSNTHSSSRFRVSVPTPESSPRPQQPSPEDSEISDSAEPVRGRFHSKYLMDASVPILVDTLLLEPYCYDTM